MALRPLPNLLSLFTTMVTNGGPDVLIHTAPFTLTTDVSLVDEDVDLTTIEEEKKKQHTQACAKLGSQFIPGVRGCVWWCLTACGRDVVAQIDAHWMFFEANVNPYAC